MELAESRSSNAESRIAAGRAVTLAGQVLLSLCAAFWTWFVIADGLADGPPAYPFMAMFLGAFGLVMVFAWWKPAIGGVLALAGGAYAAWRFSARFDTVLMMAGPAIVGGLALLGGAFLRRTGRRATTNQD